VAAEDLHDLLAARFSVVGPRAVWAAMLAGRIDAAKANAFVDALADLDDDTARTIADRLLWSGRPVDAGPVAGDRLRYHVERANPAEAKDRYQRAGGRPGRVRCVRACTAPPACPAITCPPTRPLAAYDRVDRLARAAKSAGDTRNLAQLRADAHLDLLSRPPVSSSRRRSIRSPPRPRPAPPRPRRRLRFPV
jgi:hypothetical protein